MADRQKYENMSRDELVQIIGIDVDADTFEQLRVLRDKIGYTAADLGNDSQPDDAPPVDAMASFASPGQSSAAPGGSARM